MISGVHNHSYWRFFSLSSLLFFYFLFLLFFIRRKPLPIYGCWRLFSTTPDLFRSSKALVFAQCLYYCPLCIKRNIHNTYAKYLYKNPPQWAGLRQKPS
ncbi:hypothetical protein HMPREF1581_00759 [Gardnerella vaginalis JCP8108]|uniref:Uncharacterized protein n=1 Tax=Gardnerella vaginalis JCP8108 TaxID=1261066 RepID=S4I278_GARVA|nr:hypothetical protein HMPREF1581_00759 [Gardnerella vaginalis JCP8108]